MVLIMKRTRLFGMAPLLFGVLACSGDLGEPVGPDISDPSAPGGTAGGSSAGQPGPGGTAAGMPGADTATPGTATPTATATPGVTAEVTAGDPPGTGPAIPDAVDGAVPLEIVLDGVPLYSRMMRLTHPQWEQSARFILNVDDTQQQQNLAEDVSAVYTFSNHEELLFMNANLYRDYQLAAEELAASIGADDAAIQAIYPGEDAQGFIETVGRRAYRRPLTAEEVQKLQAVYDEGAGLTENGNTPHARGAALVLQTLMQSPHFLYRTEFSEPGSRLTGYEIAAKLSLLLRGVTPDDALLDAAGNGELDTDDGVRRIAEQMLNEPTAADVMMNFHGELFKVENYLNIVKDEATVPEYSPELNEELAEAAYMFFDRIYAESLGLSDILTSTVGFVGPTMAPLYGVEAPAFGMEERDLGPERPGFFTHLPFLVYNSQNEVSDPIHRGLTLNKDVLCGILPRPAPGTDISIPACPGCTTRERISNGSGPDSCGAPCHAPYINPLGFAFENFDGLGRIRTMESEKEITTRAQYPFTEGTRIFDGAPELMEILSQSSQAHTCYAKHLANFALQRELTEADQALLDALAMQSLGGASVRDLVLALVTNPTFTTRATGGAQ